MFLSRAITHALFRSPSLGVLAAWGVLVWGGVASAQQRGEGVPASFYIAEYEIIGVRHLSRLDVERAVYPFLGPERTVEDVEAARAALQKAYHDRGYQTVSVQVPRQNARSGIVLLQAVEATVGRLRVHGSKYHDLEKIKQRLPSMQEGKVPDFKQMNAEMVALSRRPDLRVMPSIREGVIPGTRDIDLEVEDTLPLHGSLELNNRHNSGTTPWRVNAALRYDNLWQLGHSVGLSYQVAPERPDDARVWSGFYLARLPHTDSISFMLQATKQDSDVSTLGGAAVVGRGQTFGGRLIFNLPGKEGFYHTLSLGMDHKRSEQEIVVGGVIISTPVSYLPFTFGHSAGWTGKGRSTELNNMLVWQFRGLGTDEAAFNNRRYLGDDGFFYYRGDLAHTQDLRGGFQVHGKVQGQLASGALINNEQLVGGGLATVRGYLESTALGDNGVFGTLELRTPNFLPNEKDQATGRASRDNEWRAYAFAEGGRLKLRQALPDQQSTTDLASVGLGSRIRVREHFNASVDAGLPLTREGDTRVGEVFVTLRFWAEF